MVNLINIRENARKIGLDGVHLVKALDSAKIPYLSFGKEVYMLESQYEQALITLQTSMSEKKILNTNKRREAALKRKEIYAFGKANMPSEAANTNQGETRYD